MVIFSFHLATTSLITTNRKRSHDHSFRVIMIKHENRWSDVLTVGIEKENVLSLLINISLGISKYLRYLTKTCFQFRLFSAGGGLERSEPRCGQGGCDDDKHFPEENKYGSIRIYSRIFRYEIFTAVRTVVHVVNRP